MPLARVVLVVSARLFAATGLSYLFVPAAMLSVVGITGPPTEVFLIRAEVALVMVAGAVAFEVAHRVEIDQRAQSVP